LTTFIAKAIKFSKDFLLLVDNIGIELNRAIKMNINSLSLQRFFQPGQHIASGASQKHPHEHQKLDNGIKEQRNSKVFAEQKLFVTLQKTLQGNGVSLAGLDAKDFSPEKVAGRLLDFAEQASKDNPEKLEQIKKGFKQGFKQAKKMLKGMGLLEGEIKQNFEATRHLVKKGLESLKNESTVVESRTTIQFQAISKSLQQSGAIEIATKEGDLVKIDFSHIAAHEQSAFQFQDDHNSISIFHQQSAMQTNFNVSVQGDLNEDELQAIETLMGKINKVANAFFEGDTQAAFSKAQKIGFDMEQLAEFSVDLSSQQNVTAVSAYQQVNQFADTNSVNDKASTNAQLQHAHDFLNQVKEFLADTGSALGVFENPKAAFSELFSGIEQSALAGLPTLEDEPVASGDLVDHLASSVIEESLEE
jgi:hypothetical protein